MLATAAAPQGTPRAMAADSGPEGCPRQDPSDAARTGTPVTVAAPATSKNAGCAPASVRRCRSPVARSPRPTCTGARRRRRAGAAHVLRCDNRLSHRWANRIGQRPRRRLRRDPGPTTAADPPRLRKGPPQTGQEGGPGLIWRVRLDPGDRPARVAPAGPGVPTDARARRGGPRASFGGRAPLRAGRLANAADSRSHAGLPASLSLSRAHHRVAGEPILARLRKRRRTLR
jgi:hypothetical protein